MYETNVDRRSRGTELCFGSRAGRIWSKQWRDDGSKPSQITTGRLQSLRLFSTLLGIALTAPEPVLPDAGNSNPVAAECAKPARYGSGPRIPPRSSAPPATPSTVRSRSPMLPAYASARAGSSSSPLRSGGACVRRARLSSDRAILPLPVVAPTDSPIAGARRPAAPPRTDEFPLASNRAARKRRCPSA
jgi:hypothetical protein